MANKQIGWSEEENLLWNINKQIERLTTVIAGGGGGSGTVTSVSVVSTNGFAGSVATATTTPAITISTTVTGIIKGNGTAISAAVAGTDYLAPGGSGAALTGVYLLASGGTLTGTNTIVQAGFNTTHTGIGKVTFSPTTGASSVAGFNAGSVAGAPTTLASGDIWYNSTTALLNVVIAGTARAAAYFVSTGAGGGNRVVLTSAGTTGLVTDSVNLQFATNRLAGTVLYLTLSAGAAAAGSGPLIFTSGTNLTTPVNGCVEYNGTNLFFTRAGAVREGVLTQSAITTEVVVSDTTVTVNIGGTTYKLLARA